MNPIPANWKKGKIDAVGVTVLAALTAGGYLGGIAPAVAERARADSGRDAIISAEREVDAIELSLTNSRSLLGEINARLAKSSIRLESADQINRRLDKITDLASTHKMTLHRMEPGTASLSNRYTAIPIRLEGAGGFASCVAFLGELNKAYSDLAVAGLTLQGNPTDEQVSPAFEFDLVWYAAPADSAGHGSRK